MKISIVFALFGLVGSALFAGCTINNHVPADAAAGAAGATSPGGSGGSGNTAGSGGSAGTGQKGDDDPTPIYYRFALLANKLSTTTFAGDVTTSTVDICINNNESTKNDASGQAYWGPIAKALTNGSTFLNVPGVTTYFHDTQTDNNGSGILYLRIQAPGTDCATGNNQLRVIKDPDTKIIPGFNTYVVYGSFAKSGGLIGKVIQDPDPIADVSTIQIFNGTTEPVSVAYQADQEGDFSPLVDAPPGGASFHGMPAGTPTQFMFQTGSGKLAVPTTISYEAGKVYTFFVYKDDNDELGAFGCDQGRTIATEGSISNSCNFK